MDTYEKKYKDALERAKKLEKTCDSAAVIGWCEYIFPELAESKDERIRKELIFYLGDMPEDTELRNGVTNRDVLVWLERQGEPMEINPTEFDTRLQNLIGKFDNLPKEELIGSLSFWLNVVQNDGTYKDEEKQGEQKASCTTIVETGNGGINALVTKELPTNDCDDEQKPTWSKEDESYLNTTIAYLKDAKEFKKTAENCITWLKSLKQRKGELI